MRPVHLDLPRARFARHAVIAAPAQAPEVPPRPHGELGSAPVERIRQVAAEVWPQPASRRSSRDRGLQRLGRYLGGLPGASWQQRWEASGLNGRGLPVRDLESPEKPGRRTELTQALEAMFCLRIIQLSLEAFRANHFVDYPEAFRLAQADDALDAFFAAVTAASASRHYKRRAVFDVCCALTTQGIGLADLTPEAFLHYARTTRDLGLAAYSYATYVGHLAWQILHETGHFPRSAPPTLRAALRAPQLTPAELVDQYPVRNTAARQMLTGYLERRSHDLDYGSLSSLATLLVRNFWSTVEDINPGQADLRLTEETYQQWRAAIAFRGDGKPRLGVDTILIAVRALYFDIQAWAAQEPARWARWAAPCPIPSREMRGGAQRRRRTRERIADRIRRRQPLLPALVEHVETMHQHLAELLPAELFHVIACILRRLTRGQRTVPLATRYDTIERVTSDPQPFLFQRHIGQRTEVMTPGAVGEMLRRTGMELARQRPEFADHRFTSHDFRRLFATDLVNHGLPIHIGAALLGHLNLEVTRGYVAVFEEDVIRHYQAHLARRREQRPRAEYRPATAEEWQEFEEHFDKRKLELGNCGRPYATPCQHEHACIRCPMLRIDPKMLGRLDEIETDLLARRAHAEAQGWIGEVEGINLTLTFLHGKREDARHLARAQLVHLGLPAAPTTAKGKQPP